MKTINYSFKEIVVVLDVLCDNLNFIEEYHPNYDWEWVTMEWERPYSQIWLECRNICGYSDSHVVVATKVQYGFWNLTKRAERLMEEVWYDRKMKEFCNRIREEEGREPTHDEIVMADAAWSAML